MTQPSEESAVPLPSVTDRAWAAHADEDAQLRLAVVGLGWWTREFALPAIAATGTCRATVAVSGDPDKRAGALDRGIDRALAYEEFRAGAATDRYDAVYVCTPNALHLPHVETAAAHGKAVLCEKPVEASYDRARRLVAACREADVTLMIAYRLRTDPAVWNLRRAVGEGLVGDPVAVQADMSQPLLTFFESPDQWRLDPDLVGPGTSVMDLGIYPVDTARYLLDADPVRVAGATWSGGGAFEAVPDERAAFRLEFPEGLTAQCSVSQNAALTGTFDLIGTEGRLRLTPAFFGNERTRLSITVDGVRREVAYDPVDQVEELFAYFADRVLAGDPVRGDGGDALVDARTLEAIYEAAERDRPVAVDAAAARDTSE